MALSALIHKPKSAPVATQDTQPTATVAKVASVTVANLTKPQNPTLSGAHRQTLLAYLEAIGEDDQALIDEYLAECEKSPSILFEQLRHAKAVLHGRKTNSFLEHST